MQAQATTTVSELNPVDRRIIHWFKFCYGYDLADWDGFLGLFQGLGRALNVDGDLKWEFFGGRQQ